MPTRAGLLLRRVPLFAGLPDQELDDLSGSMRLRRFAKGEVVFHRDDPGASLFIIDEGSVKIGLASPDGREVILTILGEGAFFGELALLDGEPRSADATAIEPSQLFALHRKSFLAFLQTHPRAAAPLMAAISLQVRRLTNQVYDSVFLDIQTRLARAILKLSSGVADDAKKRPGTVRLTQTQLGAIVGATRESVNKSLGFYERRGILRREKGAIVILQEEELTKYSALDAYIPW